MSERANEPCCAICGTPWIAHQGLQLLCQRHAAAKAEAERLRSGLVEALGLLKQAVITEGDDAGVLLESCESTTHYDKAMKCVVYDNECFSPMGELLVEIANKLKSVIDEG